jgi:phosphate transport system protein
LDPYFSRSIILKYMTHLDTELQILKTDLIEMWNLVMDQLTKAYQAIENADCELVEEIHANEKRVDAFELKINMDCENILALFNPVASDLRLVLAVLKINYNLERIGDYANSITKLLEETTFNKESIRETRIKEMFEVAIKMLTDTRESFEKEDTHGLMKVFKKDEKLDKVNKNANNIVADLISDRPKNIHSFLNLLSIIRKLERVGDQTKNIAEEIVFYVGAKVIRHHKKKNNL